MDIFWANIPKVKRGQLCGPRGQRVIGREGKNPQCGIIVHTCREPIQSRSSSDEAILLTWYLRHCKLIAKRIISRNLITKMVINQGRLGWSLWRNWIENYKFFAKSTTKSCSKTLYFILRSKISFNELFFT